MPSVMPFPIKRKFEMSGIKYLADTNAFIYLLQKHPGLEPLLEGEWLYSFITEIELLGKRGLPSQEESVLKELLNVSTKVVHHDEIDKLTIKLRRSSRLKTPDAIIAATALYLNIPLISGDKDFLKLESVDLIFIE